MTPHSHTDDRPRMAQRTDWRIARRGLRRDQPFFSFIHSSFTNFLFAMYVLSPPAPPGARGAGGSAGFFWILPKFCAKKREETRVYTLRPASTSTVICVRVRYPNPYSVPLTP